MVRGPLFALRLSLLALAFSLGAFLAVDGFLVVPLAAPHLRAVHLDSTCLPAAERDRTNSEKRVAKGEERPSGYNRANASTAYWRDGRCRSGLSGGLPHHVAHLAALRPNIHWPRARLSPAGAHLRCC